MSFLNTIINNDIGASYIGASNIKEIDPVTGAALIAGGGSVLSSLLGGLFSSSSTSSTNSTNYAIAQMNNEYNAEQLQKLIDYNWEMWNADNEYNSASSQVERYLEAGLNPAIMMTSGSSAGTASSLSAPSAAPAQGVTMQPTDYSFIGDAISQGVQAFNSTNLSNAQSSLMQEQANAQILSNEKFEEKLAAELQEIKARAQSSLTSSRVNDILADLKDFEYFQKVNTSTADIQYAANRAMQMDAQTKLFNAQTNMAILQSALSAKQLEYFDDMALGNLSLITANIQQAYANAGLSRAQTKQALSNALKASAEARGIELDNEIVSATSEKLIEALNVEYQDVVNRTPSGGFLSNIWRRATKTTFENLPFSVGSNIGINYSRRLK